MNKIKHKLLSKYSKSLRKKATKAELKMIDILKKYNIYFKFQKGWLKEGFYISDFYLPDYKTVIEIDGGYHETRKQILKDQEKNNYYKWRRFKVLRFTNSQVLTDLSLGSEIIRKIKNEENPFPKVRASVTHSTRHLTRYIPETKEVQGGQEHESKSSCKSVLRKDRQFLLSGHLLKD